MRCGRDAGKFRCHAGNVRRNLLDLEGRMLDDKWAGLRGQGPRRLRRPRTRDNHDWNPRRMLSPRQTGMAPAPHSRPGSFFPVQPACLERISPPQKQKYLFISLVIWLGSRVVRAG